MTRDGPSAHDIKFWKLFYPYSRVTFLHHKLWRVHEYKLVGFQDCYFAYAVFVIFLILLLCHGHSIVEFSFMRACPASKRVRSMRGDTLPGKFNGIADEKLNVSAPGG